MGSAAHPGAMAPKVSGTTRTAPPRKPGSWPSHPRMRLYTLFGATGLVYLLLGFAALHLVWALGEGPERWGAAVARLASPLALAFHAISLASVLYVGARFFRLFPKSQPAKIGPLKPPPGPVILIMLYAAWVGVTVAMVVVLAGGIF